jgi:hypothetical protein
MSKDEAVPNTCSETEENHCKSEESCPIGHDVSQTDIWVPNFRNVLLLVFTFCAIRFQDGTYSGMRVSYSLLMCRYNNMSSD